MANLNEIVQNVANDLISKSTKCFYTPTIRAYANKGLAKPIFDGEPKGGQS